MAFVLHHYWRSSSSWRVRWALAFKGIEYEARAVDLVGDEQLASSFANVSPMHHVPSLEFDDRALTESVAIIEYLEEIHPTPPLLPKHPFRRARTRQLVEFVNAGIQPLHNLGVLRRVSPDTEGQRTWIRHWLTRGLEAIERELGAIAAEVGETPGPHALGASLTMADLYITPTVYTARRWAIDLAPFPRTVAVDAAALETEACKASHPDKFKPAA